MGENAGEVKHLIRPSSRPFLRFVVDENAGDRSLGHVLRTRYGMSRTLLRRLRRTGHFEVDGAATELDGLVKPGQAVAVYLPTDQDDGIAPEPLPLHVVFEDDHLIVVDKPAGILVHPSGPVLTGTLANGVAYHLVSKGEANMAGPVTRLDRLTSGLVLFAKHPHAHYRCSRAMQSGALQRKYLALAEGLIDEQHGQIDAPIGRIPGELSRRAVNPNGQSALTHFKVIERFHSVPTVQAATLLELTLITGRTHQIRVHLSHIGHPIVGDALYGRTIPGRCERQALHAFWVHMHHPIDQRPLTWVSPLPSDIQALLEPTPLLGPMEGSGELYWNLD